MEILRWSMYPVRTRNVNNNNYIMCSKRYIHSECVVIQSECEAICARVRISWNALNTNMAHVWHVFFVHYTQSLSMLELIHKTNYDVRNMNFDGFDGTHLFRRNVSAKPHQNLKHTRTRFQPAWAGPEHKLTGASKRDGQT